MELSKSKLSRVPDAVGKLVNLTSLVLKSNKLDALPETVNSLTKLKLLDVSDNKIRRLPSFSALHMLTSLNLAVNSLEGDLDIAGLDNCEKLTIVDVSGDSPCLTLSEVTSVVISGNSLTSLGSLELSKLPHLTELLANHNQLESLSPDIADNWTLIKK